MSLKVIGIGEALWDLMPAGMQLGGAPATSPTTPARWEPMPRSSHGLGMTSSDVKRMPQPRTNSDRLSSTLGLQDVRLKTDARYHPSRTIEKIEP